MEIAQRPATSVYQRDRNGEVRRETVQLGSTLYNKREEETALERKVSF